MPIIRRLSAAVALVAGLCGTVPIHAQDRVFFGIATGEPGSVYYPLGGMVAQLISNTVTIGGKKLAATGEVSPGPIANAQRLGRNEVESAFVPGDVLDAAWTGRGAFEGKPMRNLRALGALYPEPVQLVIAARSPAKSLRDLKGKAVGVSVALASSPLLPDLLDANGMTRKDLLEDAVAPQAALEKLRDGTLAAAFIVAGAPAPILTEFAYAFDFRIVPLAGPEIDALRKKQAYVAVAKLPAYTYAGQAAAVDTVAIMTVWATHADMSNEMAYEVTKALYDNAETLAQVHPKGREIAAKSALQALPIPLHPGAEKYFREKGLLK
jgi:TRAP transporter TAXI family solute receptor